MQIASRVRKYTKDTPHAACTCLRVESCFGAALFADAPLAFYTYSPQGQGAEDHTLSIMKLYLAAEPTRGPHHPCSSSSRDLDSSV